MAATPYLDKIFALASPPDDPEGPDGGLDADGGQQDWDEGDWGDVRSHLEQESPWFGKVMRGESPGDPDQAELTRTEQSRFARRVMDQINGKAPLGEIRLTPHTAEASTVPKPTRPPGGPGLFHIKGRELPPYVQHLWHHLRKKYGDHRAYGMAIGIVKKWAAGVNPGGKGKGHKVHSDVQAAAAKNVAQWEKDKADSHLHGHSSHADGHKDRDKVAASATEDLVALGVVHSYERDIQGRMQRVNEYIKDNRLKIGVIGPEAPVAKAEMLSLYRGSPQLESQFRDHLREARAHYAAGRHEEAISALTRAQDVVRQRSMGFTVTALEKQKNAIAAEKRAAAMAQAVKHQAATAPAKRGLLGRLGRNPVAASQGAVEGHPGVPFDEIGLARVREYVRRGPHGRLEDVAEHEQNFRRAASRIPPRKPFEDTAVFDFDGVLHADRSYRWPAAGLDFAGIREAHKRKFNVAVVTANDAWRVAAELNKAGFHTAEDPEMRTLFWDGGPDGRTILVTNRKVSGAAYIDDKAVNHAYGDSWSHTLDQVERMRAGFRPLPQGDPDEQVFSPKGSGSRMATRSVPGDGGHTELSRSEGSVKVYLAAPASWPSGKPYSSSLLPPGPTTSLLQGQPTKPGVIARRDESLRQEPSQTVAASPPLPPGVTLPTAEEIEALAAQVPDVSDVSLSNSVRTHLRTAAGKIQADDRQGALAALRSAQTGIHAAYRAALRDNMPVVAQVQGAVTAVPPAEQSSATAAMFAGRELTEKFRGLNHQVATQIDRFRRYFFHGQVNQAPNTRLTGATENQLVGLAGVKGYERENRFGRIVTVHNYIREGKPYSGKLVGDDADDAIKAGVAKGEYGQPTGYFQTSDGKKMWGWYGAAGLLVRHTDPKTGEKRYLLQKRAPWVDDGNTYSVPGGAMDHINGMPETPEQAAHRESREELGRELPAGTKLAEVRTKTFGEGKGAWSYHTVVMDTPHMFSPEGEGVEGVHDTRHEARGYVWATPHEMADLPLHPHFRATAEELGMPAGGGSAAPKFSAAQIAEGLVELVTAGACHR